MELLSKLGPAKLWRQSPLGLGGLASTAVCPANRTQSQNRLLQLEDLVFFLLGITLT